MSKYFLPILFITFFILPEIPAGRLASQPAYDFDLNDDWEWEDLINITIAVSPPSAPLVQSLRNNISIEDARYLLNEISELDSLQMVRELAAYFSELTDSSWIKLSNFHPADDLTGFLSTAVMLAELRKNQDIPVSAFKDMNYLPQPLEETNARINLKFDYSIAEKIIELYLNKDNSDERIKEIAGEDIYRQLLLSIGDYRPDYFIREDLTNSISDRPLQNIYKWVNPGSYSNFGGVSIYAADYEKVIGELKLNEENIRLFLLKKISQFFYDNINLDIEIIFVFGIGKAALINDNRVYLGLEYFADDYEYLTDKIMHQLFRIVHEDVLSREPLYKKISIKADIKFSEVLIESYKNGLANYAGPFGSQTRPSSLLEKDFELFNQMFNAIYESGDHSRADTLIKTGFSGILPFYTMGTQMAYIIENLLGKKALMDAVKQGPYVFFSKYIEAYTNFPARIRKVFRFGTGLEKKIFELSNLNSKKN